jgi:hypothetical protein
VTYIPLANSTVLHVPQPKGVIQFIGGFLFGSFPQQAYGPLLALLQAQGFSLVVYRFPLNPFQLNHWEVAIGLYKEQIRVREMMRRSMGDVPCFSWLGHSLGCKFIILLEVLSHEPQRRQELLTKVLGSSAASKLINQIDSIGEETSFIRDQPSLFLAPEISNTVRLLRSGWRLRSPGSRPNQKQTEHLIKGSPELFNLFGVVRFKWDAIAEDDVDFLIGEMSQRHAKPPLVTELDGMHLAPLGLQVEIIGQTIISNIEKLRGDLTS